MQDNIKRGECTLFWMKILFILFIFLFFVNNAFGESVKNVQQESVGLAVAYLIFSIACGLGFLISSVMFLVYYFSWLHRAIANLRVLTKTDFSPIGAIILTLIPIIGFVFHFWIFNNMVENQQKCMDERGILKERIKVVRKSVTGYKRKKPQCIPLRRKAPGALLCRVKT